jgi:paraquat-inducible protein A
MKPSLTQVSVSNSGWDDAIACHECDLLLPYPLLSEGQSAYCPRCGYLLDEHKVNMLSRTFAVSLAGLVAFFPAVFMPMIGLEALGRVSLASLAGAIQILFSREYYLVSLLLFFFTVLVPLARLTIIFYLVVSVRLGLFKPHFIRFYRYFCLFKHWGMLEVFLLGIIVSLYKLLVLANVIYGPGLLAYCLLLFSSVLLTRTLDEHQLWYLLGKENKHDHR